MQPTLEVHIHGNLGFHRGANINWIAGSLMGKVRESLVCEPH